MVKEGKKVVVAGLGEVGRPLLELLSTHYRTVGVDIKPPAEPVGEVDVLHVCYPFEIKDFIGETAHYIDKYKPRSDGHQQHGGGWNDASGGRANRRGRRK